MGVVLRAGPQGRRAFSGRPTGSRGGCHWAPSRQQAGPPPGRSVVKQRASTACRNSGLEVRDVPRWAFFVPLATFQVLVGVVFGPQAWRRSRARRFGKAQRNYLQAQWPRFHGLAEEFAGFFGPNKTWSVYSLAVRLNPVAPELAERVTAMNGFAYSVERAARITPENVAEAQHLMHGLESAVNEFEGKGTAVAGRAQRNRATREEPDPDLGGSETNPPSARVAGCLARVRPSSLAFSSTRSDGVWAPDSEARPAAVGEVEYAACRAPPLAGRRANGHSASGGDRCYGDSWLLVPF